MLKLKYAKSAKILELEKILEFKTEFIQKSNFKKV